MISYVLDQPEGVANWVSAQLGGIKFGPGHVIGIAWNGEPICGVVYHGFQRCVETKAPLSIMATIASTSPRWATRGSLGVLFRYPFVQLGVRRMTTMCDATKPAVIDFNKRLGFKPESILRFGWSLNKNAMLFRMLNSECRWIRE